jgi:hypothetical protein
MNSDSPSREIRHLPFREFEFPFKKPFACAISLDKVVIIF